MFLVTSFSYAVGTNAIGLTRVYVKRAAVNVDRSIFFAYNRRFSRDEHKRRRALFNTTKTLHDDRF